MIWLDYQGITKYNKIINQLLRFIIDFRIYIKSHTTEKGLKQKN